MSWNTGRMSHFFFFFSKGARVLPAPGACFLLVWAMTSPMAAHEWHRDVLPPPGPEREALREHLLQEWQGDSAPSTPTVPALTQPVLLASNVTSISTLRLALGAVGVSGNQAAPWQATAFQKFSRLQLRWDSDFLYIGSNGLPDHNMMVGITNWQQQVPLPQSYFGDNAWRLPLHPVPASQSVSIKGRFLRGAIALAVNGIPIFNPQNNRGEVSQEIGELDQWGGHCGRADDYHYHAAPLHLQTIVGKGQPIAYALDGYPIYGVTEPDGSTVSNLDECNGHDTPGVGYHYHASTKYPYVNGGFHGVVVEAGGQVDPQPRATPVRQDLPPLRGAKITDFKTSVDGKVHSLVYAVNGKTSTINYADMGSGAWRFQFVAADGSKTEQNYQARERAGGSPAGGPRPREDDRQARRGEGGGRGGPGMNRREGPPPDRREQQETPSPFGPDALKKPNASFVLSSSEVSNGGNLPVDYTGDGSGATLPLSWRGAPAGTKSFAIVMDHLAPGNVMKSYWTVWDIPPTVTSLPRNVQGVGKVGTSFKGQLGYEPPHSQGPGAKTYVLTVYALSEPLSITQPPREVNRDVLLGAMKDKVLASSSLSVVYTRSGSSTEENRRPPRREDNSSANGGPRPAQTPTVGDQPPTRPDESRSGGEPRRGKGGPGGKGGPDNKGLIKPTMDDTVHVNVYADNWFVMFINGELVAVDSIKFTPHNVVSLDILPQYPMTIAIMAKDNADPKTGLEYGDHIGDGGFIIKFADGTVSNAAWKAKNFFKGPLNRDVKNPTVEHTPIPDGWWTVDFDDSQWPNATEYTEERVNPKEPFYKSDFAGAKFIWSDDLDLDNTVIFRLRVEKPGWKPRWNTHPDLDITGAPFK